MKTSDLTIESVYTCATPQGEIPVYYNGMTEDKYVFIPYDLKKSISKGYQMDSLKTK